MTLFQNPRDLYCKTPVEACYRLHGPFSSDKDVSVSIKINRVIADRLSNSGHVAAWLHRSLNHLKSLPCSRPHAKPVALQVTQQMSLSSAQMWCMLSPRAQDITCQIRASFFSGSCNN